MKKSTLVLVVLLGAIVIGGLVYFLYSSPVGADVGGKQYGVEKIRNIDLIMQKLGIKQNADKVAGGITPKIFSEQNLTLKKSATDQYQVVEPVQIGSGFGIQIALPSGLTPEGDSKWSKDADVGVVVLDKTFKKIVVYPITAGAHKISCQIGTQTIVISFSDQGYASPSTSATVTATSTAKSNKTKTATPTVTVTATTSSTVATPLAP
jgi:hypothetical protein